MSNKFVLSLPKSKIDLVVSDYFVKSYVDLVSEAVSVYLPFLKGVRFLSDVDVVFNPEEDAIAYFNLTDKRYLFNAYKLIEFYIDNILFSLQHSDKTNSNSSKNIAYANYYGISLSNLYLKASEPSYLAAPINSDEHELVENFSIFYYFISSPHSENFKKYIQGIIAHELGHAIFRPYEFTEEEIKSLKISPEEFKFFNSIRNMVEDVYLEKNLSLFSLQLSNLAENNRYSTYRVESLELSKEFPSIVKEVTKDNFFECMYFIFSKSFKDIVSSTNIVDKFTSLDSLKEIHSKFFSASITSDNMSRAYKSYEVFKLYMNLIDDVVQQELQNQEGEGQDQDQDQESQEGSSDKDGQGTSQSDVKKKSKTSSKDGDSSEDSEGSSKASEIINSTVEELSDRGISSEGIKDIIDFSDENAVKNLSKGVNARLTDDLTKLNLPRLPHDLIKEINDYKDTYYNKISQHYYNIFYKVLGTYTFYKNSAYNKGIKSGKFMSSKAIKTNYSSHVFKKKQHFKRDFDLAFGILLDTSCSFEQEIKDVTPILDGFVRALNKCGIPFSFTTFSDHALEAKPLDSNDLKSLRLYLKHMFCISDDGSSFGNSLMLYPEYTLFSGTLISKAFERCHNKLSKASNKDKGIIVITDGGVVDDSTINKFLRKKSNTKIPVFFEGLFQEHEHHSKRCMRIVNDSEVSYKIHSYENKPDVVNRFAKTLVKSISDYFIRLK